MERPGESAVAPAPRQGGPWAAVGAPRRVVTDRFEERLREKERTELRRRWTKGTKRLAAVLAAVGIVFAFLLSPLFALDPVRVEVSGLGEVVDPLLVDAAIAPYEGRSLALINVPHVEHTLEDLPGVKEAIVERVWPRGLRITITTRVPVAAIPDAAGGYVLLDDDAARVSHVDAPPADLPVVSIPLGDENQRILRAVITVVNELPADLLARVESISAQTEDSVSFQVRGGPRVEWGGAEESQLKASVLLVLLAAPESAGAAVIDVSAPTLPITRSA